MQCRMTTRRGSRCTRAAEEGGLGFCWQHLPVESTNKREKWKTRMEKLTLLLSTAELVIKIGELAIEHLHELHGDGDPTQTGARHRLENMFWEGPRLPALAETYDPGARVDWKTLEEFVREAAYIQSHAAEADLRALPWLESKFTSWFDSLNDYHRTILLNEIQALANATGGFAADAQPV